MLKWKTRVTWCRPRPGTCLSWVLGGERHRSGTCLFEGHGMSLVVQIAELGSPRGRPPQALGSVGLWPRDP